MNHKVMKPALVVRKGGELRLSGEALTDLMRTVLAKGKPFRFRARGFSMSPFIKDGDIVMVTPFAGTSPRTGDIVAFLHPETGKVAVHRIIKGKSGLYSLKGDNSPEGDGDLAADRILGHVTCIDRDGKKIQLGRSQGGAVIAALSRSGWLGKGLRAVRHIRKPRSAGSS